MPTPPKKKNAGKKVRDLLAANREAEVVALGKRALDALDDLAGDDNPMLAARAIRAAGLIGGEKGATIVEQAARGRQRVLRVAATLVASEMEERGALILARLQKSKDVGIQKWAKRGAKKEGGGPPAAADPK